MVYNGPPLSPEENARRAKQLHQIITKGLIHEKGIDSSNINSWDEFIALFGDSIYAENPTKRG